MILQKWYFSFIWSRASAIGRTRSLLLLATSQHPFSHSLGFLRVLFLVGFLLSPNAAARGVLLLLLLCRSAVCVRECYRTHERIPCEGFSLTNCLKEGVCETLENKETFAFSPALRFSMHLILIWLAGVLWWIIKINWQPWETTMNVKRFAFFSFSPAWLCP